MSNVHHFTGSTSEDVYTWDGVEPVEINTEEVHDVLKHVLVGPKDDAPVGQKTFYDQHPHEHGVVILHGKARVQINDEFHELGPLSSVFISGNDIHQFTNIGETPLGFICVINRQE